MAPQRFRLSLTPLEDRTVPSVSPQQLAGAIAQTNAAQEHLDQLIEKQVQNFNVFMVADLRTSLRKVTTDSLESARILAEYQNDVDVLAQSDSSLGGLFSHIAELRYTAGVNAVYATRLTTAVGGVAITGVTDPIPAGDAIPPTPPPAPPAPPAPPPPDVTTNAGTTGKLPDITASTFRDLGTGVKVQDVAVGQGAAVTDGQDVNVFYTGFLKDGTVFDGNRDRGATTFNTNGVIQGFKQGLIGMQPGGVRNISIPAALGYGAAGSPPSIPPNSDLVFEVKLLSATNPAPRTGTTPATGGTTGATGTGATGAGSTTTGGGTSGTGASSGAGGTSGTGATSGSTGTVTPPATGTSGTAGTTAAPGTTGSAGTTTAGTNSPTGTTTPGTPGTVTPGTTTPVS